MFIKNSVGWQAQRESRFAEMRIPARARETSHVYQRRDLVCSEQAGELVERARGVTDGPDRCRIVARRFH